MLRLYVRYRMADVALSQTSVAKRTVLIEAIKFTLHDTAAPYTRSLKRKASVRVEGLGSF